MLKAKDENAITLVGLVITIVILIILAGVAIRLTLGENGIFERAKVSKVEYEKTRNKRRTRIRNN